MTKRIIPCLDMKDGRVVKGVQFDTLRDAGDPVELAAYYDAQGADEIVFLDISASLEGRQTTLEVIAKAAEKLTVPFTVGGGIHTLDDVRRVLEAGATKISINSAAIDQPLFIRECAQEFGTSCIVVAIDAAFCEESGAYVVYTYGGTKKTSWTVVDWAKEVEKLGAGEILLTVKDRDGEKSGFDLRLTKEVKDAVHIPVIASGGAGMASHFYDVLQFADAALAASVFHFKETSVTAIKDYLRQEGVAVQ